MTFGKHYSRRTENSRMCHTEERHSRIQSITRRWSSELFAILATALIVELAFVAVLSGQTRQVSQPTRPSSEFTTMAFDTSASSLAPRYRGHDAEAMFTRLSAVAKKGEFETTSEYQRRLEGLLSSRTIGTLTYRSTYAFLVDDLDLTTSYDADAGTLTLSIDVKHYADEESGTNWSAFSSRSISTENASYIASNPFGVKVRVRSGTLEQYEIAFNNRDQLPGFNSEMDPSIILNVALEPKEAQAISKNVRVLAICRLVQPFATSETDHHQGTVDNPLDLLVKSHYIHAQLLGLWVYNISSGRVLSVSIPNMSHDQANQNSVEDPASQSSTGSKPPAPTDPGSGGGGGADLGPGMGNGYQIMTPTDAVDFSGYVRRLLVSLQRNWYPVIPESARRGDKGAVVTQFKILPGGQVPGPDPTLIRTSGKELLDHAAMSAIRASNPFEPLPSDYHRPYFEIRVIFLYNLPLDYYQ